MPTTEEILAAAKADEERIAQQGIDLEELQAAVQQAKDRIEAADAARAEEAAQLQAEIDAQNPVEPVEEFEPPPVLNEDEAPEPEPTPAEQETEPPPYVPSEPLYPQPVYTDE